MFGDTDIPILYDWRLRECDFGTRNGSPAAEVKENRRDHWRRLYPGVESHEQPIARVAGFLADLPTRLARAARDADRTPRDSPGLEHSHGFGVRQLVAATFEWHAEGREYRLG